MKYHYQYVSKTTVRIELIPEYAHEIQLLETLLPSETINQQQLDFFKNAVENYSGNAHLINATFMNFPRVALCSFSIKKDIALHVA